LALGFALAPAALLVSKLAFMPCFLSACDCFFGAIVAGLGPKPEIKLCSVRIFLGPMFAIGEFDALLAAMFSVFTKSA
jgi:hypothetical protein